MRTRYYRYYNFEKSSCGDAYIWSTRWIQRACALHPISQQRNGKNRNSFEGISLSSTNHGKIRNRPLSVGTPNASSLIRQAYRDVPKRIA